MAFHNQCIVPLSASHKPPLSELPASLLAYTACTLSPHSFYRVNILIIDWKARTFEFFQFHFAKWKHFANINLNIVFGYVNILVWDMIIQLEGVEVSRCQCVYVYSFLFEYEALESYFHRDSWCLYWNGSTLVRGSSEEYLRQCGK